MTRRQLFTRILGAAAGATAAAPLAAAASPALTQGGILRSPQLIRVGTGDREVVIPIDRLPDAVVHTVHVHIDGRAVAEQVARDLMDATCGRSAFRVKV